MHPYGFALAGACLSLFFPLIAQAQSTGPTSHRFQEAVEDKDPLAILELGAASSWNFSGGTTTFAPNFAAEVTPIENWLELEAGVSPFYTRNAAEWDTDLLFKSRGHSRRRRSSCLVSAPNGFISGRTAM